MPAQLENGKALFVAKTPSVGYAVYDVEAGFRRAGFDVEGYELVA